MPVSHSHDKKIKETPWPSAKILTLFDIQIVSDYCKQSMIQ